MWATRTFSQKMSNILAYSLATCCGIPQSTRSLTYFSTSQYCHLLLCSNCSKRLLNSSATYHVTIDLANFNDIVVGNSAGLSITHIGSLTLPWKSYSFQLNNVLCVPFMNKILLSVSQICQANNDIIVFTSILFHVKDPHIRAVLHQGPLKDGVYTWSSSLDELASLLAFTTF